MTTLLQVKRLCGHFEIKLHRGMEHTELYRQQRKTV
jgi:hypothetical protein